MTTLKIAKIGDKVRFKRHDFDIIGEVFKINENSVLVNISNEEAKNLNIDTPKTVISHNHYKIVQ